MQLQKTALENFNDIDNEKLKPELLSKYLKYQQSSD